MPDSKNGAKSAEKIPALIVVGRIHGSNVNQAAVFLKKDAEAAKKAALDAGLSSLEPAAAPNPRPHRRRFPPISGGNLSQGRWFLRRALIRTTIWTAGGKRSSSASTMVNSSSVGAVTPTSPGPAAARNILPYFTRKSLAFDSSGYERNHHGRCFRANDAAAD